MKLPKALVVTCIAFVCRCSESFQVLGWAPRALRNKNLISSVKRRGLSPAEALENWSIGRVATDFLVSEIGLNGVVAELGSEAALTVKLNFTIF